MGRIEMALRLFELGAIRLGKFTLKSGMVSPIYVDLRLLISEPKLLTLISAALHHQVLGHSFQRICGVPYTALPLATAISIRENLPMVLRRKEKKEYGTGKRIEGIFMPGEECLLVEDVVTSGQSLWETIRSLQEEGLRVSEALVVIDRGQGGVDYLKAQGIRVHALFTLPDLLALLHQETKISSETVASVLTFIQEERIAWS